MSYLYLLTLVALVATTASYSYLIYKTYNVTCFSTTVSVCGWVSISVRDTGG